jgi:hypothetical protein
LTIALSMNDIPMAQKIIGVVNYIYKSIAKEKDFDVWRVCTLQKVKEDVLKWWNVASVKECK